MAQLTRWVLAHKRVVVVFWVALTLVGMASAGSASKALKQKLSVPGREGWVSNQQIARDFRGTGGNGAPLLPVVTLPPGQSPSSHRVRAELAAIEARLLGALPGGQPPKRCEILWDRGSRGRPRREKQPVSGRDEAAQSRFEIDYVPLEQFRRARRAPVTTHTTTGRRALA